MKKILDYFQFELGVDRATTATILTTLITFILGLLATVAISYIVHSLKRRQYRRATRPLIKGFFETINKKRKRHLKLTEQKFMSGEDVVIYIIPNYGQSYLQGIDKREFICNFDTLFNKKRTKLISRFFEIVEFSKTTEEIYNDTMKSIIARYEKHEAVYQENLDELRKLFDRFIRLANNNKLQSHPERQFIEKYLKIFGDWFTAGANTKSKVTNNEIVKPILVMARQQAPNDISQEALEYGLKCERAVLNIDKINEVMRENSQNTIHNYKRIERIGRIVLKRL